MLFSLDRGKMVEGEGGGVKIKQNMQMTSNNKKGEKMWVLQ